MATKIDAVLRARPRYRGVDQRDLDRLGIDEPPAPTAVVAPSLAGISAAHAALARGEVAPQPMLFANLPSVADAMMGGRDSGDVLSLEVLRVYVIPSPGRASRYTAQGKSGVSTEPLATLFCTAE